jgi:Cu+-exporting ATPase
METISLKVGGMSCASCASSIEKEVASLDGVISSSVNFAVETGKFEVQDNNVRDKVVEKIKSLGYSIADDKTRIFLSL